MTRFGKASREVTEQKMQMMEECREVKTWMIVFWKGRLRLLLVVALSFPPDLH